MDIIPIAENDQKFGPWVGVPKSRQALCAVIGCMKKGQPHRCFYDGANHHHGCIHYNYEAAEATSHGLKFRDGWGWLCVEHYNVLKLAAVLREKPALR